MGVLSLTDLRCSVIIPCYDDGFVLKGCLNSLLRQELSEDSPPVEIIVICNGCRDDSAKVATSFMRTMAGRGLSLTVLDVQRASKPLALNVGDAVATGSMRVYLDADIICEPTMLRDLMAALSVEEPRYATGSLKIPRPASWLSRHYGDFWARLPSVSVDIYGVGLYAVNAAGRRRWAAFPDIHSDDTFVQSNFRPEERVRCRAHYYWPVPEGLRNILQVRLRWTEGHAEYVRLFGHREERKPRRWLLHISMFVRMPVSAVVFSTLYGLSWLMADRTVTTSRSEWRRAR